MSMLADDNALSQSSQGRSCTGSPVLEQSPGRVAEVVKGMLVRRVLPNADRRMVGAWCFLDYAGPFDYEPGHGTKVGPHPHIGLQTFTWLIEGAVVHRDSLGNEQVIRPGQVNLMTAGRGIVHAEESLDDKAGRLHGVQLWIALPDSERHREPAFQHCPVLPRVRRDGFDITVLAGHAFDEQAPPIVFTPLVGLDLVTDSEASSRVPLDPAFEHAVICLSGKLEVEGTPIEPGTLLYLGLGRGTVDVHACDRARILLIGGAPFDEDVLLWWNFAARTRDEMELAAGQWKAGHHFGAVPGTRLPRMPAPERPSL
jgi:redox-sensitive bicupin YhaK (pirin superfamily)